MKPKTYSITELLNLVAQLPPHDVLVLQLQALFIPALGTNELLMAIKATGILIAKFRIWTFKNVHDSLNKLVALGLLNNAFECNTAIQHQLVVDVFATKSGMNLVTQVLKALPHIINYSSSSSSYNFQKNVNAIRYLRLTIYTNEVETYKKILADYNRSFSFPLQSHILASLFANTDLDWKWLSSRNPEIQYDIFKIKLDYLTELGIEVVDIAALITHYRIQETKLGYEKFKWLLFYVDIMAGRINMVKDRLKALGHMEGDAKETNVVEFLLVVASIDFLEDRNSSAIEHFRQALKLYRKELRKRRAFFTGLYGVFFLLALIRNHDPTCYIEIEVYLDDVVSTMKTLSPELEIVNALLLLLKGLETQTQQILQHCRLYRIKPFANACLTLVEYFYDPALVNKKIKTVHQHFETFKYSLPLVARIYAEMLERIVDKPAPYTKFLTTQFNNSALIQCVELIPKRQPWERTLDSLTNFLKVESIGAIAAPIAVNKSKRLAWFIERKNQSIEVLEQSQQGRTNWSAGRAIAMKRLYGQNRLDYLTDQDRQVLRTIQSDVRHGEEFLQFNPYHTLLALVGHPVVFDAQQRDQHIELVSYPVELVVTENKDNYQIGLSHNATTPTAFLEVETPTRWRVVDFSDTIVAVRNILGEQGLQVPKQAKTQVLELLKAQHPSLPIRADIDDIDIAASPGQFAPVLQIQPLDAGLKVTMVVRPFGPSGPCYLAGQGGQSTLAIVDGERKRINRDFKAERETAKDALTKLPTLQRESTSTHEWIVGDPESAFELLVEIRACEPPLTVEWPEGKSIKVRNEVATKNVTLKIARSRDWFQVEGTIQIDEELVLDMQDLLQRLDKAQGRFIELDDGSFVALTRRFQKQLERLRSITENQAKGLKLSLFGSLAAKELIEDSGSVKADKEWQDFVGRLTAAEKFKPVLPSTLQAELRDYQLEGFNWLSRLAYWHAGACLADDMGLGKTVQAIAVMLEQARTGPCLVLAPTSVCHNWEHELARFAPTLTVQRLGATSDRAGQIANLKAMEVLVTSYGLLHQEIDDLEKIEWQMVVFDEAQAIKNAGTRRAQAGQRLRAQFRLALTGTPIENYLEELWSLFAVVNPGLLGSRESFNRRFTNPIERNKDDRALQALRALIRPFILRRTKSAVLTELPPRTELVIEIDLPDEERAFYEALRRQALENLAQLRATANAGKNRIHILAEIMRLRRACCHPGLVDAQTQIPGAKLEAFLNLVDELLRNRHKALVFSQFVGQLERVRQAIVARGIAHQYLDGSTPAREREKRVAAFQAGEGDIFLISLRAGGTGLNLTAADYIIHLDPWWNPAVEDQASDRAHRIGQQRPVTVYRLIVNDSIEEQIIALHRNKRDLADDILEGSEVSARLTDEDLLNLIRI